jgi:phosphohistidine phosphatase SixA/8-oxo-dGTP pyrophosphatase MutT (NUDIX family)
MNDATADGPSVRAAGGVVTRRNGPDREFLVVHRPRYDDWSLPKGKLDKGEKYSAAAKREIEEETGSRTRRLARIGSVAYNSLNANPKLVRYWLFEHKGGKFKPNAEVDEIRWLTAADARALLTYPRDVNVFDWAVKLADSPRSGRVHLVRHARAGSRSSWKGKDIKRPLTGRGRRHASIVSSGLTATPVGRIYSSPYIRCRQTLEPLSRAIDEKVRDEPALAEGANADDLTTRFAALEGKTVAMCSHGAEIASLLEKLVAAGALLEPRPVGQPEKGGVWQLELTAGRVIEGRYTPAPA